MFIAAAQEAKESAPRALASTERSWEGAAAEVHQALMSQENSDLFNEPVNLNIFTDYTDVVAKPMDFLTILERLGSRTYASSKDYIADVRLVFSNSRQYNEDDPQ